MRCGRVRIIAAAASRVDVYDSTSETRNPVQEVVIDALCDVVGGRYGEVTIHGDPHVSLQTVAEPANSHFAYIHHAVDVRGDVFGASHEIWIDRVQEALSDAPSRLEEHPKDDNADYKSDDRVSRSPADGNSGGADENRERGQAVGAGMKTVGDERGGPDTATHPKPVAGDDLVAYQPDACRGHHEGEVVDVVRVKEPLDRLPGRDWG